VPRGVPRTRHPPPSRAAAPLLDLSPPVPVVAIERGLLDLAFEPTFAQTAFVYIHQAIRVVRIRKHKFRP